MKVKELENKANEKILSEKSEAIIEQIKEYKEGISNTKKILKKLETQYNEFLDKDIEDIDVSELEY